MNSTSTLLRRHCRWAGKTLVDAFSLEFPARSKEYYLEAVKQVGARPRIVDISRRGRNPGCPTAGPAQDDPALLHRGHCPERERERVCRVG